MLVITGIVCVLFWLALPGCLDMSIELELGDSACIDVGADTDVDAGIDAGGGI